MLKQTFFFLPGFGLELEKYLWQQGCQDWDHFLEKSDQFDTKSAPKELALEMLYQAKLALEDRNFSFFERALNPANTWRAWPDFQENCVYLDIETNGIYLDSLVTVIGLYDGKIEKCLVKGKDLESFPELISKYAMIVTFNGTSFDLPMLKRAFPKISFNQIHLDLCYVLRNLGYKGGLKKIEKQLGIFRDESLAELTGRDAVRLWQNYLLGSKDALGILCAYNLEDVKNLEYLSKIAYDGHKSRLFEKVPALNQLTNQ